MALGITLVHPQTMQYGRQSLDRCGIGRPLPGRDYCVTKDSTIIQTTASEHPVQIGHTTTESHHSTIETTDKKYQPGCSLTNGKP